MTYEDVTLNHLTIWYLKNIALSIGLKQLASKY
jgi:hypothetical protein